MQRLGLEGLRLKERQAFFRREFRQAIGAKRNLSGLGGSARPQSAPEAEFRLSGLFRHGTPQPPRPIVIGKGSLPKRKPGDTSPLIREGTCRRVFYSHGVSHLALYRSVQAPAVSAGRNPRYTSSCLPLLYQRFVTRVNAASRFTSATIYRLKALTTPAGRPVGHRTQMAGASGSRRRRETLISPA